MWKAAALALVLATGAAHAEADAFLGNWKNPDWKASGLMHVAISPNGGNRVDVRAYGDCHPMECDWGLVQGKVYYAGPQSNDVAVIIATFHYGYAHRQVTFKKGPDGQLQFEMATIFDDNSDRRDFVSGGMLKPTTWVGPIGPTWQAEPGLQTGWGGGARSGLAPPPQEDCTVIGSTAVRAVQEGGNWVVKAGGKTLVTTAKDAAAAQLAEAAFHHYRFDRLCRAGGEWKPYWRTQQGFGSDRMGGVYCLSFHATTAHVVRSNNSWNVVDGATTLVELGPFRAQADALLGMIRAHRLTGECFIGSPDIMTFWLAEPK